MEQNRYYKEKCAVRKWHFLIQPLAYTQSGSYGSVLYAFT